MKKLSVIILSLFLVLSLYGCNKNTEKTPDTTKETNTQTETNNENKEESRKKVTVTTPFIADMIKNLADGMVDVETIMAIGDDPHLYVAKPNDLKKIQSADLVLYHGLHFEGKMLEALESTGVAITKNFKDSDIGIMDEDGEEVVDPHFWFDVDLYKEAVKTVADELANLIPDKKSEIEKNRDDYLNKLTEADEYVKEKISEIPEENRFLVTPHDAFNYFSRRYNIPVISPQGVSTDGEVSVKDLEETVNMIVEKKIKAIFAESTTDPRRMTSISDAAKNKGVDCKVVTDESEQLLSDSIAPVGEYGDNFIDMLKRNADIINKYLK